MTSPALQYPPPPNWEEPRPEPRPGVLQCVAQTAAGRPCTKISIAGDPRRLCIVHRTQLRLKGKVTLRDGSTLTAEGRGAQVIQLPGIEGVDLTSVDLSDDAKTPAELRRRTWQVLQWILDSPDTAPYLRIKASEIILRKTADEELIDKNERDLDAEIEELIESVTMESKERPDWPPDLTRISTAVLKGELQSRGFRYEPLPDDATPLDRVLIEVGRFDEKQMGKLLDLLQQRDVIDGWESEQEEAV